jgi:glycosyltransferase involved in cell wall biosynthesis
VTEPIRILRVIARLNVGGPAQHVLHLSRELDRRGYRTTLVAGRVGEGEGSMEPLAAELGVEPVYVRSLQREISLFEDAAAVLELVRLLRRERPRILHTHTAKAGTIGRIAARLAGPARPEIVVHTFHGHVLRGYFSPFKTRLFRLVERALAHFSDSLVAVSPEVREELVRMHVAPPGKIAVVRLGLDLEQRVAAPDGTRERVREELRAEDGAALIGWLGRMTEIKCVDVLLRAFARVRSEAVLVLVGDGPLRPAMEALAAELGVTDRCRFVGYANEVSRFYAACDVIALSSANEGTPVTLIEALAAGVPVVSTDVGGVRDVVEDGRSGLLVPAGDVEALGRALDRLAGDRALRRELGGRGRDVIQRYSIPRLVDDLDLLYRELLEAGEPTAAHAAPQPLHPLPRALPPATRTRPAKDRLRVTLLSQYFPPEVGATQSRMQAFAEHLAERGHDVTVICEFPNHPMGEIPPEYHGRIVEDDRSNPYRVLRVWVLANPEKTQLTRMGFYLSYMAMATAVAPRAGRADVVVATTPPLFTGAAGLAIARMNGAPLVLDVRDLWPAAAVSLDQISSGWPLKGAELLERQLYRRAAAVVAVTRPFCDHIDGIRRCPPRTTLIPNGTLELFFAEDGRTRLGVDEDRFLVTFAGTLGIAQALPTVLEAAERLRDEPVTFAFVGEGPVKDRLVRRARFRKLDNVVFHQQVPLEEVPGVLAGSDALLVPLSGHPTFKDFVPSKMVDYMAAGRPVILSAAGESARILERAGGGVAIPPEDPDALVAAVRRLARDGAAAGRMGERGREFARTRLRSEQAERLEQLLLDVRRRR